MEQERLLLIVSVTLSSKLIHQLLLGKTCIVSSHTCGKMYHRLSQYQVNMSIGLSDKFACGGSSRGFPCDMFVNQYYVVHLLSNHGRFFSVA